MLGFMSCECDTDLNDTEEQFQLLFSTSVTFGGLLTVATNDSAVFIARLLVRFLFFFVSFLFLLLKKFLNCGF